MSKVKYVDRSVFKTRLFLALKGRSTILKSTKMLKSCLYHNKRCSGPCRPFTETRLHADATERKCHLGFPILGPSLHGLTQSASAEHFFLA